MKPIVNFNNLTECYFENAYAYFNQSGKIQRVSLNHFMKVSHLYSCTNKQRLFFTQSHVEWLEFLLINHYNFGIYRLLLKVSHDWRVLHTELDNKTTTFAEPVKVFISTENKSHVK